MKELSFRDVGYVGTELVTPSFFKIESRIQELFQKGTKKSSPTRRNSIISGLLKGEFEAFFGKDLAMNRVRKTTVDRACKTQIPCVALNL